MFFATAGIAVVLLLTLVVVVSGRRGSAPEPAQTVVEGASPEEPAIPVEPTPVAREPGVAPPGDEATPPPRPIAETEEGEASEPAAQAPQNVGRRVSPTRSQPPPTPDPDEAGAKGQLSIRSTPSGEVRVNGKSYGYSPVQLSLPPGNYTVVVSHPEYGTQTVGTRVIAKKTMMVKVDL